METSLTMDVEQAGKLLGLSRRTAYRLAAAGTIPTLRLGRKLRVSKLALDELLRRGVMSELYYITNDIAVYEASIVTIPDSGTADTDEQGYLILDGTHRGLEAGIGRDGVIYLWMTTNGDPAILADNLDAARNLCIDMGDAPDDEDERLQTGAQRILAACDWLDTLYQREESAECIDWYRDKVNEVLAAEGAA